MRHKRAPGKGAKRGPKKGARGASSRALPHAPSPAAVPRATQRCDARRAARRQICSRGSPMRRNVAKSAPVRRSLAKSAPVRAVAPKGCETGRGCRVRGTALKIRPESYAGPPSASRPAGPLSRAGEEGGRLAPRTAYVRNRLSFPLIGTESGEEGRD